MHMDLIVFAWLEMQVQYQRVSQAHVCLLH
jgi:hypothetical protein